MENIALEGEEMQLEKSEQKTKKKKTNPNFSINVCNARHELDLLKAIIAEEGYKEVYLKDAKATVIWQFAGSAAENNIQIMNQKAIYNYMPGIGHFCNKKETASIFRNMIKHYPDDFEFVPKSYLLPEHTSELETAMSKKKN